jgi:predicted HAD superfamily Cof-like phosphohydrolase
MDKLSYRLLVKQFVEATEKGVVRTQEDLDHLRQKLFEEEYQELKKAMQENNTIEFLDAVVDMFYIAEGTILLDASSEVQKEQIDSCENAHAEFLRTIKKLHHNATADDASELLYNCFMEVHNSNMRKLKKEIVDGQEVYSAIKNDGLLRHDLPVGKILKPFDWEPPNLKKVYEDWQLFIARF